MATKVEWSDNMRALTQWDKIGLTFIDSSPIFNAFNIPERVGQTDLKVNWSSGSTAGVHDSAFSVSSAAAKIHYSKNYEFGYVTSTAQQDINTRYGRGEAALRQSYNIAMATLYDNWVYYMINGAGSSNEIMGIKSGYLDTMPVLPGYNLSGTGSGSAGDIFKQINTITSRLPDTGYNIIITSPEGYTHIENDMMNVPGGVTAIEIAQANFGYPFLPYKGNMVLKTRRISTANGVTNFYIVNVGPEGVQLVTSDVDMIDVRGGADGLQSQGTLADYWDITLVTQLIYNTNHCVGCILGALVDVVS